MSYSLLCAMNPRLLIVLLLVGAGVVRSLAQGAPGPDIKGATEYEFPTTDGAAYLLEGTVNGQTWTTLAGPIFGDGKAARALLPPAAAGQRQLRLRPVSAATYGAATTQLGGKTLVLNDHGRARQLIFFPSNLGRRRGVLKTDATHARVFEWQVRRTTGNLVTVDLTFFDGTSSRVELTFSNGLLGAYQMRDQNTAGIAQVTEGGGFSLHTGRIRDESHEAVLPSTLAGQSVLLEESGTVSRYDFGTAGLVILHRPDGSIESHPYQYSRNAPGQAEVRVGPGTSSEPGQPDQPGHVIALSANSQATGSSERMPLPLPGGGFPPGTLPKTGTFNVPTAPVVANSTTGPPKSLTGKTLQINGDEPVTLTFNGDGTGTATRTDNGSVEVTPFTFDYSPTDDDEASLTLTFPGALTDRVEDYDLEFSPNGAGSFRGSTYEGGELSRSTSGTFDPAG
jgi:hypothetical protein